MKDTCVECMERYLATAEQFARDCEPGGVFDQKMQRIRALVDVIVARDHQINVRSHPADCKTCKIWRRITRLEVHCSCGWAHGCTTAVQAEQLMRGHLADPSLAVVNGGPP
jgi:hypothetical protein